MSKKDSNKKVDKKTNETTSKKTKVCPIKTIGKKTCNLYKNCNISKRKKYGLILILIILAFLGYKSYKSINTHKTEIHTPVISRTELNKKPTIKIEVFEDNKEQNNNNSAKETTNSTNQQVSQKKTTKELKTKEALEPNLKEISNKIETLETSVKKLEDTNKKAQNFKELNSRISKLENLEGTVGKMSNIFLAQQLVLLDNAFKVGGNYNIAIQNIQKFAETKAKNEKVAKKLSELLNITQEQAIVTPQALLFYAKKLESIKLNFPPQEKEVAKEGFFNKIKAILKSFISIRKADEVKADQEFWNNQIITLEESIIFADFITTQKILDNKKLQTLGGEDFINFTKLFKTYLIQQQALQAVLGTFIEGYNYDY